METKIIYSRNVAYELRKKGFKILRTEPNPRKPQFDLYVFEASPELFEAMGKMSKKGE